jgi:hypothetical protein
MLLHALLLLLRFLFLHLPLLFDLGGYLWHMLLLLLLLFLRFLVREVVLLLLLLLPSVICCWVGVGIMLARWRSGTSQGLSSL